MAWSWVQISCPALSLSTQGSKPSLSPICNYCTSVQVYILVHQLQISTTAQRRWKGDNRFRRIISAPPRRSSLASRTRNPRLEAKNSIEPCFRCPSLHTALRGRRGSPIKFQMPVKLHPGVEVHSDAKTATLALSGTIQESGSINQHEAAKGTSTPVQNGQGRWRPAHGKVVKIVHRRARSIIIR